MNVITEEDAATESLPDLLDSASKDSKLLNGRTAVVDLLGLEEEEEEVKEEIHTKEVSAPEPVSDSEPVDDFLKEMSTIYRPQKQLQPTPQPLPKEQFFANEP